MYIAVQQVYRVSSNYDVYISFRNKDGKLGYKIIQYTFNSNK